MTDDEALLEQYRIPAVARWVGYIAACIGMFMAILDIQVVVTALRVIEEELGIGADYMSWVQTAYIIAEVIAIPLTGLLVRVFSMRWLFVIALTGFILSSIGCAQSSGFADLLAWRVVQGFCGGVLIPIVFSSIFLLFPKGTQQLLATTIGGVVAVLAPTLGPLVGGWITENYSWQWVFLINVGPGLLSLAAAIFTLPKSKIQLALLKDVDWLALLSFGLGLALLIVALKEAPVRGWVSLPVLVLFVSAVALSAVAVFRPRSPILFHLLKDRALAYGCILSFLLGFTLFSAVYVMPVFLAFVRGHGPLQIGVITLVMGVSQIIAAPMIVQIDRYINARILAAIGFAVLAAGLLWNASLTIESDYDDVFWPQVLRGAAVALCILPPIRMALALMPLSDVNDASGLFNLVRNVGGAIGIAVSDTIMFGRSPVYSDRLLDLLKTDAGAAAKELGVPLDELPANDDPTGLMNILDVVQAVSMTQAVNDCWMVLGAVSLLALPVLWFVGPIRSALPSYRLN